MPNLVASKAFLAIDSGAAQRKPGSLVENRNTIFRRGESKSSASNGYFPSTQIVTNGGKCLIWKYFIKAKTISKFGASDRDLLF